MRKIKLDISDLHVRSFETQPTDDGKGTVRGHDSIPDTQQLSCALRQTNENSCLWDCECTNRYMPCINPNYSFLC